MVAFAAGKSEGTLFQNRIATVPKRERETDCLMAIADARQAVFVPAKGTRPCVIVRQIVPRRAIRAVVFTHGPPRALTEVRAPALPVRLVLARLFEPLFFGCKFS